jgi:hypothetical protein
MAFSEPKGLVHGGSAYCHFHGMVFLNDLVTLKISAVSIPLQLLKVGVYWTAR